MNDTYLCKRCNNTVKHCNRDTHEFYCAYSLKKDELTDLIPCRNYYPGVTFSDGATTWADEPSVSYYGATDGSAGVAYGLGDIEGGITIEGRWKRVTMSSADACMCHLKAVPSRTIV